MNCVVISARDALKNPEQGAPLDFSTLLARCFTASS
jgi:hypothetical protein